jgi:hypothetical protein
LKNAAPIWNPSALFSIQGFSCHPKLRQSRIKIVAPATVLFDHILRGTLDKRLIPKFPFCPFQVHFQLGDFLVQTFALGRTIRFSYE